MIDLEKARPYYGVNNFAGEEAVEALAHYLGLYRDQLLLTGSSLIGDYSNDIDIIIAGADHGVVDKLYELVEDKVFNRISMYFLLKEYFSKHSSSMDINTYLYIKGNTILHLQYNRRHINLKLVKYLRGVNECIEPVIDRHYFSGTILVIDSIEPYALPAKFHVRIGDEYFILETYRELFSELKPGKYYVQGYIEVRDDYKVLNIDHGFIRLAKF
ncbi:hypothetical protein [Staphylothermus hellenicus]|uniref:hypothetical protein n=1 Tax=Staphylothermus hellenicus TaxID=84599 RepID=UPI0001C44D0F|nr:hypothetical protein [Staphylothermus hellenicus]